MRKEKVGESSESERRERVNRGVEENGDKIGSDKREKE